MHSTNITMLSQPRNFRVGLKFRSYKAGGCSTPTSQAMKKDQTTQSKEPELLILPATK